MRLAKSGAHVASNLVTRILFLTLIVASSASDMHAQSITTEFPYGIAVHGAGETLRAYCARDSNGVLWLSLPSGDRFELVESVHDPAITNAGDGAFHPFEETQVRAALAEVRYPLRSLRAEVFLLPFPRRHALHSAAAPGVILLSPGVRALSIEKQHAELVHELGHIVQYALMPDVDEASWRQYRRMRGIEGQAIDASAGAHANRPHEIFAEDFRALFGGATANSSGSIENAGLIPPAAVAGLANFFLNLTQARTDDIALWDINGPALTVMRPARNPYVGQSDSLGATVDDWPPFAR